MLNWFPSSDVIVFIVSAFSFHWASSYSWEYQSVRKRELENTRVSKQGYFFVVAELFSPYDLKKKFFFVRTLMQRTPDRVCLSAYVCVCVCVLCLWKRDREEVHCYPFSLCTVELSMIHWWSFQCGAITEPLPISTPPPLLLAVGVKHAGRQQDCLCGWQCPGASSVRSNACYSVQCHQGVAG